MDGEEVLHTIHVVVLGWLRALEETTVFQVFFDDNVGDGVKHKLDVLRVCGAGHVGIDFFDVSSQVKLQELQLDVITSIFIGVWAIIIREAHAEVSLLDLLCEDIFLVEEEYDGGGCEVTVVANTVEQVKTLVHAVHFIILHQHHVVSAEGSNENDTGDPLKAMDPLLSFGTLTTHIKHPEV